MRCKSVARAACAAVAVLVLLGAAALSAEGQTVSLVSGDPVFHYAQRLTTDGIDLYVTEYYGKVLRLPIGGGTPTVLYSGPNWQDGITLLGSDLYWCNPNGGPITDTQIYVAPKDGSGPVTAIYTGYLVGQPIVDGCDIVTDGSYLFVVDGVQGRVVRLNFDGSGITQLASLYGGFFDLNQQNGIALDGDTLYVVNSGTGSVPPMVSSLPKAGGAAPVVLWSGAPLQAPMGIAVGGGSIYISDYVANTVWQQPLSGGMPTPVVPIGSLAGPFGITYHNDALYVAEQSPAGGGIYRIDLSVAYGVIALYDESKAHKSGSTVPIKLKLTDASGANVSSSSIVVHAVRVEALSPDAAGTLDDSGAANPDYDFRYDSELQGYVFNLSLAGYATGTYNLVFTADGDRTVHKVAFQVK